MTIPFGIAAFRLAGYALWPSGRTVVAARTPVSPPSSALRGSCCSAGTCASPTSPPAIALCLTIIGIPFGLAGLKLSVLSLMPLGRAWIDDRAPADVGRITLTRPRLRRDRRAADAVLAAALTP